MGDRRTRVPGGIAVEIGVATGANQMLARGSTRTAAADGASRITAPRGEIAIPGEAIGWEIVFDGEGC